MSSLYISDWQAGYADEVSDAQIDELVSQLDEGGDGKISFDEFMSAFLQ